MTLDALRTPDEAFASLPDYPFAPNYVDDLVGFEGLRVHYLDEGPKSAARTYVCLHGQPTWSYLYRRMIPVFAAAGHRVIAPDLLGFGKSDKPVDDAAYTFGFHRALLVALLDRIPGPITLVVQDWGGVLGLTLPMDFPRIDQLLVMNTAIAIGAPPGDGFLRWREYVAANPGFSISGLIARSCPHLGPEDTAAYDAPFPDQRYRAGTRTFPAILPTDPDMEGAETGRRAVDFYKSRWSGQVFMAIGDLDPVLGIDVMAGLANLLGVSDPMHIADGNHFLQEWGDPIARAAVQHFS
ncbi:MAG: haloalkane dehalogenase [Pseudomonadota bacterium]